MVPPGLTRHRRSAASTMVSAGRSLMLPPGVQEFQLGQQLARKVPPDPVEPDEGGVADQIHSESADWIRRAQIADRA